MSSAESVPSDEELLVDEKKIDDRSAETEGAVIVVTLSHCVMSEGRAHAISNSDQDMPKIRFTSVIVIVWSAIHNMKSKRNACGIAHFLFQFLAIIHAVYSQMYTLWEIEIDKNVLFSDCVMIYN